MRGCMLLSAQLLAVVVLYNENITDMKHKKDCGVSWLTGLWFLEQDAAVEFFKCTFWLFKHHKASVSRLLDLMFS